uniref:CDC like kinase 1 n=2 Tax=Sus scrofa TaxID=9823 RepID=A0A8D1FPP6_PIG
MRHAKRAYCPDWDEKDWDYERWKSSSSSHKRRKRSHSSARENKRCRYNHSKTSDSYYLESRSINEKDYHSRRYIDEYRNDYNQGCEPGHRHRDYESRYQNHSSKSSGRSGRSSYKSKYRIHHSTSHHRSHGVCNLLKYFGNFISHVKQENLNLCLII